MTKVNGVMFLATFGERDGFVDANLQEAAADFDSDGYVRE